MNYGNEDPPKVDTYRNTEEDEHTETRESFMDRITAKAWSFWASHRVLGSFLFAVVMMAGVALALMAIGVIPQILDPVTEDGEFVPFWVGSFLSGLMVLLLLSIPTLLTAFAWDVLDTKWKERGP
jgi:hypothetical protein